MNLRQFTCQCALSLFQQYDVIAKAQLKKMTKLYHQEQKKAEKARQREVHKLFSHDCKEIYMYMFYSMMTYCCRIIFIFILIFFFNIIFIWQF